MQIITFSTLANHLKHGREIEFSYKGKRYSITNHSGYWYLCNDTDHILLDTVCRFEEKDFLVSKIAVSKIDGTSIAEIFDKHLYDSGHLVII